MPDHSASQDHAPTTCAATLKSAATTAARVAEELEGQCLHSLEDVLERFGIADTQEIREAVDDLVFECSECNWWCEAGEESNAEPGKCLDCAPEAE